MWALRADAGVRRELTVPRPILLGRSQFPSLREGGFLYVDKSLFAREVLQAPAEVLLYPRPRRFGKTLNMSMLQAFFGVGPDRSALFRDLLVWQDAATMAHFQKHPVIALSFKDVKQRAWADARKTVDRVLTDAVCQHRPALANPRLDPTVRARLAAVASGESAHEAVLLDLCQALHLHHDAPVVLLIDEYDAAILNGWEHGHYDEAVGCFRDLLAPVLKDNPYLFKGVLTGILRVGRESMFSGLNNVQVYSLLHTRPSEHFGFSESEVFALLDEFDRAGERDEVRRWYNGYRFGDAVVYNPWSIVSLLAERPGEFRPYWLNTSGNDLVRSLLLRASGVRAAVATLIEGGAIEADIQEDVPLRELEPNNAWSLLLFAGYLRPERFWREGTRLRATLAIPNLEVRGIWEETFRRWLEQGAGSLEPLHRSILAGDAPAVQEILGKMLLRHASFHDVAENQDEAFYHAFMLGLLVTLERTHAVRSNRETGDGRADLLIIPKRPGLPGVVLEFKRGGGRSTLAAHARAAVKQAVVKQYRAELEAAGAEPISVLGVAFSGKGVAVRSPARG